MLVAGARPLEAIFVAICAAMLNSRLITTAYHPSSGLLVAAATELAARIAAEMRGEEVAAAIERVRRAGALREPFRGMAVCPDQRLS